MGNVRKLALAGATALMTTAANAADFPQAPPPPMPQYVRAPEVGGWYLRGDVGVGMQSFRSFDHNVTSGVWPASWRIEQKDIKDTFFVAFGVGYAWNNWLRFDVTGEYRADVKFKAVGSYAGAADFCPGGRCFDVYDGDHSAIVVLANAYIDLGTWWCLTPFIGAGVGGAFHKTAALSDIGLIAGGSSAFGFANQDKTSTSYVWAVHAGVAYNVSNNFKVEFAYRYLDMGSADTAEVFCGANGCGGNN